jgi:hypothetical protein
MKAVPNQPAKGNNHANCHLDHHHSGDRRADQIFAER